jgi:hypothetical protein
MNSTPARSMNLVVGTALSVLALAALGPVVRSTYANQTPTAPKLPAVPAVPSVPAVPAIPGASADGAVAELVKQVESLEAALGELRRTGVKAESAEFVAAQRKLSDAQAALAKAREAQAQPAGATQAVAAPKLTSSGGFVMPAQSPSAALQFVATGHDWGAISDASIVSHEFVVKNTSDKDVNVLSVQTTCGCTSPQWDRVIKPGETGKVSVAFNPSGRRGREQKFVTVTTDHPSCASIQLMVTADVKPLIVLEPQNVFFGELGLGAKAPAQELTITGRMENFEVKKVTSINPLFKVEELGKDSIELDGTKANRFRYSITMTEAPKLGFHYGAMEIEINAENAAPIRRVHISANVVGPVNVIPNVVSIPFTRAGDAFTQQILVQQRRAEPMKIISAELTGVPKEVNAVVDVRRAEQGGGSQPSASMYRIVVSGTLPPTADRVTGELVLVTDQKTMEKISIPVSAFMFQQPVPPTPTPTPAPPAPGTVTMPTVTVPVVPAPATTPATTPVPAPAPLPTPSGKPGDR